MSAPQNVLQYNLILNKDYHIIFGTQIWSLRVSQSYFLLLKNISSILTIVNPFQVLPADGSILYVDEGKLIDNNMKKYKVQLIDYHWRLANLEEAMGIVITSPITQQHIRVRLPLWECVLKFQWLKKFYFLILGYCKGYRKLRKATL